MKTKFPGVRRRCPLAASRVAAAAIAAAVRANRGGVGRAVSSIRNPAAIASPCRATPSGASPTCSMAMKEEAVTRAAGIHKGSPVPNPAAIGAARTSRARPRARRSTTRSICRRRTIIGRPAPRRRRSWGSGALGNPMKALFILRLLYSRARRAGQRQRLVAARSSTSSVRPFITALTM